MALNFPSNPATNTEYTFGTKTWVYNGFAWDLKTNATNLLEALKTVDGTDSGLDADLLDGNSSDYYTDIAARLGYTPANTSTVNAALDDKADTSQVNDALSLKQDNLVSGTNIKTVNGESVLGSGDIVISSGASSSISSSATGHTLSTAESLAYGYYGLRLSSSSSSPEIPIKITSEITNPSIILGNNSDGSWVYNGYSNNIAIGNNIYSGDNSIVIGNDSSAGGFPGDTNKQIAIGSFATAQGSGNIAIGANTTASDSSGIGTVVLNGRGNSAVSGDSGFYVNPIRDNTHFQTPAGTLQYDTFTKEIFYSPSSGGVSSFNTRTGDVTLTSGDVTGAIGFTPYDAANPSGYILGIDSSMVTSALGYTPYNSTNPSGYITGINSSMVTSALGYTPPQPGGTGASGTWGININGTFNSSGRSYSREWLEFPNHSGLYSPLNAAHFFPNNGSYGAWKIDGGRNGWNGIQFGDTSLMMNDNTYGFHRNTGGGWRFYVESGNGYFPGNVTAYWSDERLKENLQEIRREALDILGAFTVYRFNWNAKVAEIGDSIPVGKEEIGLIAQQVQRRLPDAVNINKAGAKLGQENFDYLTINYDRITPLLVEGVNLHEEDISSLKSKVAQLEALIKKLIGE